MFCFQDIEDIYRTVPSAFASIPKKNKKNCGLSFHLLIQRNIHLLNLCCFHIKKQKAIPLFDCYTVSDLHSTPVQITALNQEYTITKA